MKQILLMFGIVFGMTSIYAEESFNFKKDIQYLKDLNLTSNDAEKTQEELEQKQLRTNFYNVVHKVCIDSGKERVKQKYALDKETLDMLERVCDCYTLTMMDKVDWNKIKNKTGNQIEIYLQEFDQEVREYCKTELAKDNFYQNPIPNKTPEEIVDEHRFNLWSKVIGNFIIMTLISLFVLMIYKANKNNK